MNLTTDRNWKAISNKAFSMDNGESVILSNVDFDMSTLPDGAVIHKFDSPTVDVKSISSPKSMRTFFWGIRKDRSILRDRAIVWKEDGVLGVGVITTDRVMDRINQ
jgi:hypothetical protein